MIDAEAPEGEDHPSGRLRWFHWAVMGLSLLLTITAWWVARQQNAEKTAVRFERDARQVVDLVAERMRTYADALHAGVAMINAHGVPTRATWRAYATGLQIDIKYPGINGIGIIEQASAAELPALIARHRLELPDFAIHPVVEGDHHLPIVYVEPAETNRAAIGLDMAHEQNRYQAALAARDSGVTQMTGPIVLVQDAKRTAGFLLYAPYYAGGLPATQVERRARFQGMVYAPFIVARLLEGTLERTRRQVDFAIYDGDALLHDEHADAGAAGDPDPMYRTELPLTLFGRTWRFDVRTTLAFRAASGARQPYLILAAGVVIDLLLLALFLLIARSEERARALALEATAGLRQQTRALEASNARLERFASIAAHDLREPSRKVVSFLGLLERRLGADLDEKSRVYVDHAVAGALRMRDHVDGVMAVSRAGQRLETTQVDLGEVADRVIAAVQAEQPEAQIERGVLPTIRANPVNVETLFTNLIGNALKYRAEAPPRVEISAEADAARWTIRIADNGIGIEPQYRTQVFEMFRRLHGVGKYPGSGIGLALCEMVVGAWGGTIGIDDGLARPEGIGATVWFTVPRAPGGQVGG